MLADLLGEGVADCESEIRGEVLGECDSLGEAESVLFPVVVVVALAVEHADIDGVAVVNAVKLDEPDDDAVPEDTLDRDDVREGEEELDGDRDVRDEPEELGDDVSAEDDVAHAVAEKCAFVGDTVAVKCDEKEAPPPPPPAIVPLAVMVV